MGKRVYSNARPGLPVKGIVFDMDGVLFDTEKDSVERIIRLGKQLGFDISREMVIANMGRNMAEESRIYREILGERFDGDQFWGLYWQERNRQYEEEGIPVKEGAVKLLRIAGNLGLPCAVASSSPSGEVHKALVSTGLEPYFSCVIGGNMFEKSKPSPDIFLAAAKLLGLEPDNCIVIEDSLNGMKAGRAAGMQVVHVKDVPEYSEEDLDRYADYAFDSIEESAELL